MDAQSAKSADAASPKDCDAAKKVSGIKRHPAANTQGLLHATGHWAIAATTANVTARQGALAALERSKKNLGRVKSLLCGGSYSAAAFANEVHKLNTSLQFAYPAFWVLMLERS